MSREEECQRSWQSPTWLSRIVLLVGVTCLLSTFAPGIAARAHLVREMVPDAFPAAAATGAAAIGVILIALSRALRRGKRRAWVLAVALSGLATVLHLLKGLEVLESLLCLGLTVLLLRSRRHFGARPDPRSGRRVAVVLAAGPLVATALGYLWLATDVDGQAGGTTAADRLWQALLGLLGVPGPVRFTSDGAFTRSEVGLAVLGAAVLFVAVVVAMQPADGPHPMTEDERGLVDALLARWGWIDSLAYFATRDERSAIFSPCGQAAVSYRVVGTTSLAAGDPVGNPAAWPAAIGAWLDEARAYGWTPANLGCSERGATAFDKAGLDVLELGDEAILHVDDFSLEGRTMRGVRQAVARTSRAGVTATCTRVQDLAPDVLDEVRVRAAAWREGSVERGFSMALGRFGEAADGDAVLVTATDAAGELVGLLHLVPWGDDALSLDLMRRSRESGNGVIELMVATLVEQAPRLGASKISLNFAVFRSVFARGERLGAGPVIRLWRALLLWASRFAQIESLYRANAKYHPEWAPRYLVFRTPADLPKVATAALRAEAFLVAPAWLRHLGRRTRSVDGATGAAVPGADADAAAPPAATSTTSERPAEAPAAGHLDEPLLDERGSTLR
ncbi:phosphatidylglycerol lysyltransferase domain-containing protein [Nocardioides sp. DS6]|uniref:Phosphatidylglycerol lysyltransferase domain-containing protein n=1 Tax=Nocardioides eburneus TaxID=3231482 RepID=A0ABV3T1L7_9ACTN